MQITRKRPTRSSQPPTTLSLWEEYRRSADTAVRDRLVFTFSPMVSHIVEHHLSELPPECDLDDLVSCGVAALSSSVECYDPLHGVTLEQFAWTRVHEALLDRLRRLA